MAEEFTLTIADTEICNGFLRTQKSPREMIPDDIDVATLNHLCDVLGRAYAKAEESLARMKPFLGRVFCLYRNHPELYTDLGYQNWTDWMTRGIPDRYGISRPEAFKCVRIAEDLGHISPDTLSGLGLAKLDIISRVFRGDNSSTIEMKQEKARTWVARAADMTAKELAQLAVQSNLVDEADVKPAVYLNIRVTTEIRNEWESLKANKHVQDLCDSKDEGVIFGLLLTETWEEWKRQIADRTREAVSVT